MASNVKVLPKKDKPPPVAEPEDDDDEGGECPKCPPVGAPAWMATFADMATLLMAFFVLILAFANFDSVSFKKLSGSMAEAFGSKMISPFDKAPGATVIEMDFRPSNSPPQDENSQDPPSGAPNEGKDQSKNESPVDAAGKAMARAIRQALADGEMTVESDGGTVTVKLPPGAGKAQAQALADAIAKAAGTQAETKDSGADQIASGNAPEQVQTAQNAEGQDQQPGGATGGGAQGAQSGGGSSKAQQYQAGIAEARLQVALRDQIGQGLVEVERRDGKVFVTVGAGGAFRSGSDDLTDEAQAIMARLGSAAEGKNASITVTGHTDNVPISGGRFRDNWDLAAARASSVVRALGNTGAVPPDNLTAVSKGDSNPVADNSTSEGREKNRRIEIEMSFKDPNGEGQP
jgi:chemotaxis protein MotB